MRSDSESRSRYLSLALVSRGAINSLRSVAAGNAVDDDLNSCLTSLIAGTEQTDAGQIVRHLEQSGAWTHFEELSTVDELKKEMVIVELGKVVSSVLSEPSIEVRSLSAKRLIGFLTAVESRALQHYTECVEPQMV